MPLLISLNKRTKYKVAKLNFDQQNPNFAKGRRLLYEEGGQEVGTLGPAGEKEKGN